MSDMESRVNRLETSARRWRIAALAMGGTFGALMLGMQDGAPADVTFGEIVCEKITVTSGDKDSGSIQMGTEGSQAVLQMDSGDGNSEVRLAVSDDVAVAVVDTVTGATITLTSTQRLGMSAGAIGIVHDMDKPDESPYVQIGIVGPRAIVFVEEENDD